MTWEEALAALGADNAWEAPPDLGPLPTELVARARGTLAALGDQIQALEARRDEVGRELAALSAGPGEPSTPHYIDTTA